MAQDNINVSFGISGMQRDSWGHHTDEKEFTFQRNGNLENVASDTGIGLTNEQSNYLCHRFKPGFKVIGHKIDMLYNKIYLFTTNPETKESEIGSIKFNINIDIEEDFVEKCGCEGVLNLVDSLENTVQVAYCDYEVILNDDCNKCLNFNINYPIHDIEVRHEVLGDILVFTDGYNPPRYINLSKLEDYTKIHTYGLITSTDYNFYKPQILEGNVKCIEGYTLEGDVCVKRVPVTCRDGFTYNSEKGLCEKIENNKIDMVFLFDESGSIDGGEMDTQIDFLRQIITTLSSDIDSGRVRIMINCFSTEFRPLTGKKYLTNSTQLLNVVNTYSRESGSTNMLKGLLESYKAMKVEDLGNTTKFYLLTDGISMSNIGIENVCNIVTEALGVRICENYPPSTTAVNIVTQYLNREKGIEFTLIAVGSESERSQIEYHHANETEDYGVLPSYRDGQMLYYSEEFSTLHTILTDIYEGLEPIYTQEEAECPTNYTRIENHCENYINPIVNTPKLFCSHGDMITCEESPEVPTTGMTEYLNDVCYTCIEEIQTQKECECSENVECIEETCLDCEKLRIFPLFETPTLTAEKVQFGGRLPMGNYEFAIAYCDKLGNERTSYYSYTNKVKIFDEDLAVFGNTQGEEITNFGIRLSVKNLDKRFNYYKVIVIETTARDATTRLYVEGIHHITDNEVIYTSNIGKDSSSMSELTQVKPTYNTWGGLTVANNYLFGYDYTLEEEWNLQPIGVLMGGLVKWQSDVASENIYKDGIGNEKFTGYMRDEVYPLSFRLTTDYGYTTPLVNLVARPPEQYDLDIVTDRQEVQSIYDGIGDCTELNRTQRWQFYNTATEEGSCTSYNVDNGEIVRKKFEETCTLPKDSYLENIDITITETEGYVNLRGYIEDYGDEICDIGSEYYNETICYILTYSSQNNCVPEFNYPICEDDCDINYCEIPEIVPFDDDNLHKNDISEMVNEVVSYTHKDVNNYEPHSKTGYCMIAESNDYRSSIDYVTFEEITGITDEWKENVRATLADDDRVYDQETFLNDLADREPLKIIRKNHVQYNDCRNSNNINSKVDFYFTNVIERDINDLLTDKDSVQMGNFTQKLGKNALWYNVEFYDEDYVIVEIARGMKDSGYKDSTVGDNIVRVTIYDSCSNLANIVNCFEVNLAEGEIFRLNRDDFKRGIAYIAMDTELKTIQTDTHYHHKYKKYSKDFEYIDSTVKYISTSTNYCSFIHIRDKEYDNINIKIDKLYLDKSIKYSTYCTYVIPKLNECNSVPYKYGKFGYWQSIEEYPNNNQLYNASNLKVKPDDIEEEYRVDFEKYYTTGVGTDGYYILNNNADVTCKPIRHYKFPDNRISPFMENENVLDPFTENRIFPIGFKLDTGMIDMFLDIAVSNGMITQKQRDSITDIEFFRGDRRVHKSILYKGISNDMYKDPLKDNVYFRNFPYNSLGKNTLISEDENREIPIDHPFDSKGNNRFTLLAPEVYHNRNNELPSEINIEGYMYGHSFGSYQEVLDHSKWVILGKKLINLAKRLSTLETAAEIAMSASMLNDAFNGFRVGLVNNVMTPAGIVLGAIASGTAIAASIATSAQYTIQWMNAFKDNGDPINFASMYISPKGFYNYFEPNNESGSLIRGLKTSKRVSSGMVVINEDSDITKINNKDRETSMYLYFGKDYRINYPTKYINYDNASTGTGKSSRHIASVVGDEYGKESTRNIASPYFSLKNFVPNQYGNIDGVKWVSTGKKIKFNRLDNCETIFGGDIVISRFSFKNKYPFFNVNAMTLANRTPFKYSLYSNVGHSTYFCDYDSKEEDFGLADLPMLLSDYIFDNGGKSNVRYVRNPAQFFLFSYGVPTFLVESEINGNFRYHGTERHEQHAGRVDVYDWVQESKTSITYDNIFYYNGIFSESQTIQGAKILPGTYDKDDYKKLSNMRNGVVYSQQDNSEVSLDIPWLVYRPYDVGLFKTDYGRLIKMTAIESELILGVFENNSVIFNAVDPLQERLTANSEFLGTGGIFHSRPMEFSHTELGDNGSQHKIVVSTEFGHFIVDSKRGKVNQVMPNGKGLNVISDVKGQGQESGMRRWFKRHLPFKIHKYNIEGLTELDTDNPYKGIGILAWWDAMFKRLFITKKDYIPKVKGIKYSKDTGFTINGVEVSVKDTRYFEDVSWTLAYSPLYQSWVSYYDFKPDYAITLPGYFKTGLNYSTDSDEIGLWSHLPTNRSFGVFYGKYYPWEIEVPIKGNYTNKLLKDIKIWATTLRYVNERDFSVFRNRTFNKMIVYNQTNNSGELILNYEDSLNNKKYPIRISNTQQGIPVTHFNNKINVNYFYNRVVDLDNHVNIWTNDANEILKELNINSISMKSKKTLERLRGDWFLVRLKHDESSKFKHYFKWMTSLEESY